MKRLLTLTITIGFSLALQGFAVAHGGVHKTLMGTIDTGVETGIVVVAVDGVRSGRGRRR